MPTVLDEIRALKTEAKNRRDLRRYESASRALNRAIALASSSLSNEALRSQMAEELADCQGLLGGVQRRWALDSEGEERRSHLIKSIQAYDSAWEYESGEYGVVNSYGLVNRLVTRLLLRPDSLMSMVATDFGTETHPLVVREALKEAKKKIEAQLARPRRDDYWASADLALVNILLEQQHPRMAYQGFLEKSPPDYAFKSVLDVLRPLAQLNWHLAPSFDQAIADLQGSA